MNLSLYGSNILKEKQKDQPLDLSDRSKSDSKVRKGSYNKRNQLDLEIQGGPAWSISKEKSYSSRSKTMDSARSKASESSLSKANGMSNIRRGELDTFLNLPRESQEQPQSSKRLYDETTRDWEEISISTPKSDNKSGMVFPINKNAFNSQVYPQSSERDDESVWSGSIRTLTPGRSSCISDISNYSPKKQINLNLNNDVRRNQAAVIIQVWFRRHYRRRKLAEAAMKRMLTEKKIELQNKPSTIEVFAKVKKSVLSSKRSPSLSNLFISKYEENKINEKRLTDKRIAEQEIEKLKIDNKIHSRPTSARPISSRSKTSTVKQSSRVSSHHQNSDRSDTAISKGCLESKNNIQEKSEIKNNKSYFHFDRSTIKSEVTSREDCSVKSFGLRSQLTTIDDIFSTIKELESVDCLTERSSICDDRRKGGWNAITEDIDKLLRQEDFKSISNLQSNSGQLTVTSLDIHNKYIAKASKDIYETSVNPPDSIISDSKMNDILRFLNTSDIVDDVSDLQTKPLQSMPTKRWNIFDHTELEENSKNAVHEVSSKLMTMKLELEEKQRSVDMLQKALQQQRELTVRQVKETQKDMEKRINCQKEEYESALQRNHAFIDELISKNEMLQDKCNKLVVEVKEKTQKSEEKIKNITENQSIELKKVESKHAAAEKLRREKWEIEKTKMIKDMTIKGMESEIAQLISNHKQELRKLKQHYENEILQGDERSYEKYNRQLEDLRKQLYKEKEDAVQKEHDTVKERFDQEMQRQIQILESQRRQLYQEISDERDRINVMGAKQKSEIEKLRTQLEYKEDKVGETLKTEFTVAKEEIQRKYEAEIRELKLQSELEKQIWMETQNKKNIASLLSREQELKNEMKRTRDEEIEKVIQQLEEDNTQSKEEIESIFNNKLKRAKDKYESEINELEVSERQAKEKYNTIRAEHMELEGDHESLKVMLRQKEKEIDDIKQMYETLHREREHVSDIIRQEFADRLVATEEENRKIKRDISEIKAKMNHLQLSHTEELERIQVSHQSDMTEVHNKVKEAIKRKEENMTDLKNQFQNETKQWQEKLASSEKRSEHLESLLEQQRKQLLKLK